MEHQLCILLYSNYSSICKQLLTALQTCPVDIYNLSGLNVLCVDNEKIRKQIMNSKKITIDTVPTLLLIYQDNNIKKYEGQMVFDWIDLTVNKYLPQEQVPQIVQQQVPQIVQEQVPQEQNQEEYEEEQEQKPVKKIIKKPVNKQKHIQKKTITSIEDLDSSEDDLDLFDNETSRPPVGVRNGPGGYDMSAEFGKEEDRTMSKTKESSETKSSLMSAALAMQKERE